MLENRTIYLDRYTQNAGWSQNLQSLLMSPEFATAYPPTSMSITDGNSAGHFSMSGNNLGVSVTGDGVDMSAGTYTLTITAIWSSLPSPYNLATCTLTVICPPATKYVDFATGVDTANGDTKATCWKHAPGDPLATGNPAAFNPGTATLICHKDGQLIRSNVVIPNNGNIILAGNVGWGDGSPTWYTGAEVLAAGTAATSGEVFANPNQANIKTHVLGFTLDKSQFLIDRANNSVIQWAQWPAVVGDPFLETHDPQRHLLGGMFRMPGTNVSTTPAGDGIRNLLTGTMQLPAEAMTEFGTKSLVGAMLAIWVYASFVHFTYITGHDTSTGIITFDPGSGPQQQALQVDPNTGMTAFSIIGHPWSIKAAGQFAWNADRTKVHAWSVSGTTPEIPMRKVGFSAGNSWTAGAIYGLGAESYYGIQDGEGSAVNKYGNLGTTFTISILRMSAKWLFNRNGGNGGLVRFTGQGVSQSSVIEGNSIWDCHGAGGIRSSIQTIGNRISSNRFQRLNVTCVYVPGADSLVFEHNYMADILGPHANGFTIYEGTGAYQYSPNCVVRYNTIIRVVRPFTFDRCDGLEIYRNILEMDPFIRDAPAFWGSSDTQHVYENLFLQPAGLPFNGADALMASSVGRGLYERNVIQGLIGGGGATGTASWVNNHIAYKPPNGSTEIDKPATKPAGNTGTWSGNTYEEATNEGTIRPRWKQVVGAGYMGSTALITGIAVITITNQTNKNVNTQFEHGWVQLSSDSTRPISVAAGLEFNIANDALGTGALGWSSTPTTVANGKWLNFRMTSSTNYETDKSLTIDLGDGNVYTWTIRTMQAAGWPLVTIDSADWWKFGVTGGLASADSKYMTLAYVGRIDSSDADVWFGGYTGAGARVTINSLAAGRFRFAARDGAGTTQIGWDSPAGTYASQDLVILMTVDTTQANAAAGVKVYINGVAVAAPTQTAWTQNFDMGWASFNSTLQMFGEVFAGQMGMFFFDNRLADISDAAVRSKFTALAMGAGAADGSNIFGTQPAIFLVGPASDWNSAGGINRGYANKMVKQGATAVEAVAGQPTVWPSYTYATAITVAGPSVATVGTASSYTVTIDGAVGEAFTLTLSDGSGGAFSTVNVPAATGPQTLDFTYTPSTAGARTITASKSGLTSGTKAVTVANAPTAYTIAMGNTGRVGRSLLVGATLNAPAPVGGISIGVTANTVTGSFPTGASIVIAEGQTTSSITFVPDATGTGTLSFSNSAGLANVAARALTVKPAAMAILPGGSAVITLAQAKKLFFETAAHAVEAAVAVIGLRLRRNVGDTGPLDGIDITINVVAGSVGDSVSILTNEQIDGDTASLAPAGTTTVDVTIPSNFPVDVVIPNSLI